MQVSDFAQVNQLSADWQIEPLHAKLARFAQAYCLVVTQLNLSYNWSLMQVEYATDIIYKGFHPLSEEDSSLFRLLLSGDFVINSISNSRLRATLPDKCIAQISHLLKRLRVHCLLTKVNRAYRYYLSELGRGKSPPWCLLCAPL